MIRRTRISAARLIAIAWLAAVAVATSAGWCQNASRPASAPSNAATRRVLRELKSADPAVRLAAIKRCGRLKGAEVGKALAAAYAGASTRDRPAILAAMGERRDRTALPTAIEALSSDDAALALEAVRAAAVLGGASAVRPLADVAASGPPPVSLAAHRELVALRGAEVEATVARQAMNAGPRVRAELIGVLAERKSALGIPVFLDAAKTRHPAVALAAFRALVGMCTPAQHRGLIDLMWAVHDPAVRREAELATAANVRRFAKIEDGLAPIVLALQSPSAPMRHSAIAILGDVGGSAAIREIGGVLSAGRSTDDRRDALEALRGCRELGAVALAAAGLDDAEVAAAAAETVLDLAAPQVRDARALPAVTGPAMTDALRKVAAGGPTPELRARAARLLNR